MDIRLLMHNEVALVKLNTQLQTSQFSTINHATGTGKSFIGLKYAYQNKDKRILYLTPTYPIFHQLKKHMKTLGISLDDFKKFDHMIYRNLMNYDMEALAKEYDIIICDEYHRCGAKKWGKKIKQLKEKIKEKYPDKKMIGLTATPTRYLDNERNMTEELFDGKCASTLDLSDAIIDGLLPAPVYICTSMYNKTSINNLKTKVEKDVFYQRDKKKYNEVIQNLDDVVDEISKSDLNFKEYIKDDNGKYIAFNATINEIKENKQKLKEWIGKDNINFYEIHSKNSVEKNEKILEEFENAKDGINILCVVDILNEGIHVSGIDGIFMLRKTTSPIIYFQQLGRLLSYSGRNDTLVVWDLVGNLNHHKAIISLYDDIREKVKKLLLKDDINNERYKTILKRFKIIDNSSEITKRIDKLKETISKENIVKQRIATAVDILTGILKPANFKEKIQAHIDLYKYSKFVTVDMHKLLDDLDIVRPQELRKSNEEFKTELCGAKCLHDFYMENNKMMFKELEKYFNQNGIVPRITSNDDKEVCFVRKFVETSYKFSGELLKQSLNIVKKDPTITPFDLVYYGINLKPSQISEFVSQLNLYINDRNMINKNIIIFLRKNTESEKYDFRYYLYKLDSIEYTSKVPTVSKKTALMRELIAFSKQNNGKMPEYDSNDWNEKNLFLELNGMSKEFKEKYQNMIESSFYKVYEEDEEIVKQKTDEIAKEILSFIDQKGRYPQNNNSENDLYSKYRGFKKLLIKYGYKKKFDELLGLKKEQELVKKIELLINEVLEFIRKNSGDLPSTKVDDIGERNLANEYNKFLKYFSLEQKKLINDEINKYKQDDALVDLYVDFIKKNRRYPIINAEDEYESSLQKKYIRNQEKLSKQDNVRIKRALSELNKKSIMKNTFAELYNKGRVK